MDICKWLDETIFPEHPQSPHTTLQLAEQDPRATTRPLFPRRRSESSILEQSSGTHRKKRKKRNIPASARMPECACGKVPVRVDSESSHGSEPSERYARKPRRKTRPDRYEPSLKVADRNTHVHQSRKDDSKKIRRPSKRKRKTTTGGGIGHEFCASNVSSDRLTLKPQQQPGIFNKGKTSTIVRGRGLPDLVFSEMKFLQKPSEPTYLPRKVEVPGKKLKRDRIQDREGEISAYFSGVRPTLAEKSHGKPDRPRASTGPVQSVRAQHEHERLDLDDTAVPTIEANTEALYRGSDNRDARHESSSYVTWSDSIRAHSTALSCLPSKAGSGKAPIHAARPTGNGMPGTVRGTSSSPWVPPSISRLEENDSTDLFRISSTDVSPCKGSGRSLARSPSTPRRTNAIHQAAVPTPVENPPSPSWMSRQFAMHKKAKGHGVGHQDGPKDLTHRTGFASNKTHPQLQHDRRGEEGLSSDAGSPTLSDLVTTLQQCNDTFQPNDQSSTTRRARPGRGERLCYAARRVERGPATLNAGSTTAQEAPRVHFADRQYGDAARASSLDELWAQNSATSQSQMDEDGGDEVEGCVQPVASGDSVVAAGFWQPNRLY